MTVDQIPRRPDVRAAELRTTERDYTCEKIATRLLRTIISKGGVPFTFHRDQTASPIPWPGTRDYDSAAMLNG